MIEVLALLVAFGVISAVLHAYHLGWMRGFGEVSKIEDRIRELAGKMEGGE